MFNSLISLSEEDSLKRDKIKTYTLDPNLPVQGTPEEGVCESKTTYLQSRNFQLNYKNLEENTSTSDKQCSKLNRNFNDDIKPIKYYNNMYEFKSIIIKDNKNKLSTNKLNEKF